MTKYEEAIEYISGIPRFAPKTDLENTRIILKSLGNPQNNSKVVHVAGTNGKGSVSKMIALMLEKKGYRVGLFTSPHLVRINERISINGRDISDADFVALFDKVKTLADELVKNETENNGYKFQHPAYFEFLFVMAAQYFSEKSCDYVVYETGLGGRLDATNVTTPEVCVITSIGLDHMQYLGNTIKEIASEKAGIIKREVPIVYNTGDDTADRVIEERARELNCKAVKINGYPDDIADIFGDTQPLYQYDNAATAIAACRLLTGNEDFSEALRAFMWPGRCQWLSDNVILDGAHNEDAALKLTESLKYICDSRGFDKVSLLFAVSSDKDYESIIKTLTDRLDIEDVYVTEINSDRRESVSVVMSLFQKYLPAEKHFDVVGSSNMREMLKLSRDELSEGTLLVIVGSLYMAGEILGYEEFFD